MIGKVGLALTSRSPRETIRLGARLGRLLLPGDIILLEGPIGAGKTVFAQGIARGLEVAEPVVSPSFTLVREYVGRLALSHADLYRLSPGAEVESIGLDDYLAADGVVVVEWAERAGDSLPGDCLLVQLRIIADNERRVRMAPSGSRAADLLARFQRDGLEG